MSRPKRRSKTKGISVYVDKETLAMVSDLCEAFRSKPSGIFRQAIVRMWHGEQVLLRSCAERKKSNGALIEGSEG